ncbi:hypothetical protein [Streptococcus sp. DD12]|uniref:hypothetical protein n=1 Tax=Streptococcus sp. DD12 TaxID=1777880 RepID=UPI000792309C|nr:hypothetical protein [Streptococcus sp. DD12]KXT75903.1 hypothetical protein STRDD12_01015 [Streptococcus sp. DD12]
MAEDIMNSEINSSSGEWHGSADTITLDDSAISGLKTNLSHALTALRDMKTYMTEMDSSSVSWSGKAKKTYEDLMTIMTTYQKDYYRAVKALGKVVEGYEKLLNDTPNAKPLKEIDEA